MKNYWATNEEPYVQWSLEMPCDGSDADIEKILNFGQTLLDVGHEQAIFAINETHAPDAYDVDKSVSYINHVVQVGRKTRKLPLFKLGCGAARISAGQLRTSSRLAYFDQEGTLVEEQVENIGLLMEALHPKRSEQNNYIWNQYSDQVSPVCIDASRLVHFDEPFPQLIHICISLCTDIWFPVLIGHLEGLPVSYKPYQLHYDNRDLAHRHTLRLNLFLQRIRELTLACGGTWSLNDDVTLAQHEYLAYSSEEGILVVDKVFSKITPELDRELIELIIEGQIDEAIDWLIMLLELSRVQSAEYIQHLQSRLSYWALYHPSAKPNTIYNLLIKCKAAEAYKLAYQHSGNNETVAKVLIDNAKQKVGFDFTAARPIDAINEQVAGANQ